MTFGIDVSHFQGAIDWRRAHADGVAFAFAKATESATFVDPRFDVQLLPVTILWGREPDQQDSV